MKFGENLYNLRKRQKMSQEKLAEKVGVSRQSVSKWENGETYPEMDNILKICDIFHCKINDLVHEDLVDIDSLDEDIKMSVVKFKKEKQNKMKRLSKAIYIIARIGKIFVTLGISIIIILMLAIPFIISDIDVDDDGIIFKDPENKLIITQEEIDNNISIKVKAKDTYNANESDLNTLIKIKELFEKHSKTEIIWYAEICFSILIINLILYRIILKHLEELFININNGDTPFTLDNVNHIKKMAYLMIATIILPSIYAIIFGVIARLDVEIGFEAFNIVEILFLFSMAYIFEYGYELQLDSKGKMYGEVE